MEESMISPEQEAAFREADRRYQEQKRAQEKASEWANIRSNARRRYDSKMADEALWNIRHVHGAGPQFWDVLCETASKMGDTQLADLARDKATAESQSSTPPGFMGGATFTGRTS